MVVVANMCGGLFLSSHECISELGFGVDDVMTAVIVCST